MQQVLHAIFTHPRSRSRNPNIVITMPTHDLAPEGARPSAATVLCTGNICLISITGLFIFCEPDVRMNTDYNDIWYLLHIS